MSLFSQLDSNCDGWFSQSFSSDSNTKHIKLFDNYHDEINISVPYFYSLNCQLPLFRNAQEAILHRYIYNEFAIVEPSMCIHDELSYYTVSRVDNTNPVH